MSEQKSDMQKFIRETDVPRRRKRKQNGYFGKTGERERGIIYKQVCLHRERKCAEERNWVKDKQIIRISSRLVNWYGPISVQKKGKLSVGVTQARLVCGIKWWYFCVCFYPDLKQLSKQSNIAWNKHLMFGSFLCLSELFMYLTGTFNSGSLMSHTTD